MPDSIPLFHITPIPNLASIVASGGLLPKARLDGSGRGYANIAYQSIQLRRAMKLVPKGPGGVIHDYVPFYFAPRSPMLYTINNGNVENCPYRQQDIVHIRTTVNRIVAAGRRFVFYNYNAATVWAQCFDKLDDLTQVDWPLFYEEPTLDGWCKYWKSVASNPRYIRRMETRMAEFLVHGAVPLGLIDEIVAMTPGKAAEVEQILRCRGCKIPVRAQRAWYY